MTCRNLHSSNIHVLRSTFHRPRPWWEEEDGEDADGEVTDAPVGRKRGGRPPKQAKAAAPPAAKHWWESDDEEEAAGSGADVAGECQNYHR